MKKLITISCLALALHASAQSKAKLDSLLDYYAKEYGFNGVAYIYRHGEVLVSKGYGYRDAGSKEKNDERTIFQIGSNTKQFTSEIILQLAYKNKLSLQDKLTKYFPGYPEGDKISIENLLTHTSGIFNYTDDSAWRDRVTEPISKDALLAAFRDKPLEFKPGSKFDYSNSNYILLGFIIEKVTGKTYEQAVRDNILIPCGMTHSGFDFTHLKDENKAKGYMSIRGDKYEDAPIADSTVSYAAGALYSTVGDMNKWHRALQSYKLLPKEWQEKAYVPFKRHYGYGWFTDTLNGHRTIGHSGGIHGFISYEIRVEEDDVDVVLLQNNMSSDADNNTMAVKIMDCIYNPDFKLPQPAKVVKLSPDVMKRYEGEYQLAPKFSINITLKDNELYAQGTGQGAFLIQPTSETMFFTKAVDAQIEFVKDADGSVKELILHQNGRHMPGKRKI